MYVPCVDMCIHVLVGLRSRIEAYGSQRRTPSVSLSPLISLRQCFSLTLILVSPARLPGLGIYLGSSWDQPLATAPLILGYRRACMPDSEGSNCSSHTCIGILLPTKLSLQHPLLSFKMTGYNYYLHKL